MDAQSENSERRFILVSHNTQPSTDTTTADPNCHASHDEAPRIKLEPNATVSSSRLNTVPPIPNLGQKASDTRLSRTNTAPPAPNHASPQPPSVENSATEPDPQVPLPSKEAPENVAGPENAAGPEKAKAAKNMKTSKNVHPKIKPEVKVEDEETRIQPETLTLTNLEELLSTGSSHQLRSGVECGMKLLNDLRVPLSDTKDGVLVPQWLATMDKLQQQFTKRARTVVAVVGGTGAGKSSLINAMLDEGKIVPTNGVRACTAVVTEISHNDSDDPEKLYRAEVEFISSEAWTKEVTYLHGELVDSNKQLSRDFANGDTEAGVAYAKIKAVYPVKARTKEMIAHCNPSDLASDPDVTTVLGTTKHIEASKPQDLYSELQNYLDSKEKTGGRAKMGDKDEEKKKSEMAFWPLIKVVRVYVKAAALSSGVVLVDLPGVQDANAARSAIADKYMAQCSAIWIVSPIMRAVDDKAARDLLGNSFKLQLRLDGTYSNVTFICSKTDDISVQEATDHFGDDDGLQAIFEEERHVQRKLEAAEKFLPAAERRHHDLDDKFVALEQTIKAWQKFAKKTAKGRKVTLPSTLAKKRKRNAKSLQPRRKRGMKSDDSDEEDSSEDEDQYVTHDDVTKELESLLSQKNSLAIELGQTTQEYRSIENEVKQLGIQKKSLAVDLVAKCIQLRNEYAKTAIRADFATGIREMDEETAQMQNADEFDPTEDQRDYKEVEQSLPVFCISSRAYQQMCRRSRLDSSVIHGFRDLTETEIPQLQTHAQMLTEGDECQQDKNILKEVKQLLGSMMLWVSSTQVDLHLALDLSQENQSYEMKHLEITLGDLKKNLANVTILTKIALNETFKTNIYGRFLHATELASKRAPDTVQRWSAPKAQGGLAFGTYRATCRNDGNATKSKNAKDFNEELAEPVKKRIMTGWDKSFKKAVPDAIKGFSKQTIKLLTDFHQEMKTRPELERCKGAGLALLDNQVRAHGQSIEDLGMAFQGQVKSQQREANRIITPFIKEKMGPAYVSNAAEKGNGCFARMKETMARHVDKKKAAIFRGVCNSVRENLEELSNNLIADMDVKCVDLVDTLQQEYRTVILGAEFIEASQFARDHLQEKLRSVDTVFASALAEVEAMEVDDE